ncbi:MAG: Undecaprenyl-phosphate mannosyltransferase [Elusimicrobia bacterium ADurb.Bin231]|nr:MAG: Undecaprenyl-phosphate mannosyltransferase [Elusimicrobia bacterium ADurb.Bin231]
MELKKPLVIIPTYNESENIEKMVCRVTGLGFCVLVIDDNSPDGTGELLEKLKNSNSDLYVMRRTGKLGLGTAYIQGFKWAIKNNFDLIFTMDADFSHNPDYLPELRKKLDEYDYIIGSRYVKGGGVRNWPATRKVISRVGNFYAKTILRFDVNDCTSGFSGFKRKVIETINLENIKSEGYGFLIEMKYRTYKNGFRIFEYPIIFTDRTLGKSKISKNIIWEALFLVWKLRKIVK